MHVSDVAFAPPDNAGTFCVKKMKKIYTDTDMIKVGYYKSVLETNDIPAYIKNEALSFMAGRIPEVYPELWVINDTDFDKAVELLKEIEKSTEQDGTS